MDCGAVCGMWSRFLNYKKLRKNIFAENNTKYK
jgi:hypothetical protein